MVATDAPLPQPATQAEQPPHVWSRSKPLGFDQTVSALGGIAAPLLAGFSLATVVQLVTGSHVARHIRYPAAAITVFALAAVLLLYSLQFSALALGYRAAPQRRLDYFPEAADDEAVMATVRRRQWGEEEMWRIYSARAGVLYNVGLLAFLVGLLLVLIPPEHWSAQRGIAVGLVSGAALLELIWALSNARRPKWLLPSYQDVTVPAIDDEGISTVFIDTATASLTAEIRSLTQAVQALREDMTGPTPI